MILYGMKSFGIGNSSLSVPASFTVHCIERCQERYDFKAKTRNSGINDVMRPVSAMPLRIKASQYALNLKVTLATSYAPG
ncbi:hypothetical protein ACN38_g13052 [Penicillium nordicum]|uniref:Uncharacterized protein n=2 Tax=Penicillium nordicum TaxID=229535 RepID=A0A0M8NW90_9EURO|nr:hypothetical protein ACN38_g13052 [Penicillium nordicum]